MYKGQAGVAAGILVVVILAVGILNFAGEKQISGFQVNKDTSLLTGFQTGSNPNCENNCDRVGFDIIKLPSETQEQSYLTNQLLLYLPLDNSQFDSAVDVTDALMMAPPISVKTSPAFVKVGGTGEKKDEINKKIIVGKVNQAFLFDGIDDRIEIPHSEELSLSGSSFTLSAWVKAETREFPEFQTIMKKRPDKYGDPWPYSLNLDKENKKIQFSIATGNKDIDRFSVLTSQTEMIPLGEWIQVSAVLNAGKMQLYINGVLDSEQEFLGSVQPSTLRALSIGSSEPFELNFNGALDEVRVYNYGLSSEEIKNLFSPQTGSYEPKTLDADSEPPKTLYNSSDISIETSSTCLEQNPEFCYTKANCESIGLNWCPYEYEGGVCQINSCK